MEDKNISKNGWGLSDQEFLDRLNDSIRIQQFRRMFGINNFEVLIKNKQK